MKNVISNIKNTEGFVSLEVIIIAGALIILGGVILFFFNKNADQMSENSGAQLKAAQNQIQGEAGVAATPNGVGIPVTTTPSK